MSVPELAGALALANNRRVVMAYNRAGHQTPIVSTERCAQLIDCVASESPWVRNETVHHAERPDFGASVRRHKQFCFAPTTADARIRSFRQSDRCS